MNIKRAFLAAVAVLMLPAMAWAQDTVTFDTSLSFSNADEGTVTATLVCNTGVPLEQSFEISEASGVEFVVNEVAIDEDAECSIAITGVAGYGMSASANEADTGSSCVYTGGDVTEGENTELLTENTCAFTLTPEGFVYTVHKEWVGDNLDFVDIDEIEYKVFGTCYNVRANADDESSLDEADFNCDAMGTADVSCSSPEWYADPDGSTYCTGGENIEDSAVESDNGCATATEFDIGTTSGSCTITNTVFYEGIPTLSQYGLAIMALLMLGVGYVGFRRFV